MYLHLGRDVVARHRDIVGIFNLETSTISPQTRRFLADAEKGGRIVNVCEEELPASFIVTENKEQGETVFISQIATPTLRRRAQSQLR